MVGLPVSLKKASYELQAFLASDFGVSFVDEDFSAAAFCFLGMVFGSSGSSTFNSSGAGLAAVEATLAFLGGGPKR